MSKIKQTDALIAEADGIIAKMDSLIAGLDLPAVSLSEQQQKSILVIYIQRNNKPYY
jgi:hypothetical protein